MSKLSLLLLPLLLLGCGKAKTPDQAETPATKVAAMTVAHSTRPEYYSVSGSVAHSDEVMASFKTGGILEHLNVEAGDSFRKGELLAALDTTEIAAMVRSATELRKKYERDYERVKQLHAENVVSLEQLQNIETALATARADEQRGNFNLERSQIDAPFSGIVAQRFANQGEMVESGHPVLRLVERGANMIARLSVPARYVASLAMGDSVNLELYEVGLRAKGVITELGAVALPGTGHYQCEISFPALPELREGMAVRARIPGPAQTVIVLPTSALVSGDKDRGSIFLAQNSLAVLEPVTFIDLSDDSMVIAATLPPGAQVITDGAGFLRDGERIQIVESPR